MVPTASSEPGGLFFEPFGRPRGRFGGRGRNLRGSNALEHWMGISEKIRNLPSFLGRPTGRPFFPALGPFLPPLGRPRRRLITTPRSILESIFSVKQCGRNRWLDAFWTSMSIVRCSWKTPLSGKKLCCLVASFGSRLPIFETERVHQ